MGVMYLHPPLRGHTAFEQDMYVDLASWQNASGTVLMGCGYR